MTPTPPFDPEDPPARPIDLDDADALSALVATYPLVLVEFYTEGCGICQSMDPVLSGVAHNSDAVVATINPRDDPPLLEDYRITSVPTFVRFEDGEAVDRLAEGFVPSEALTAFAEGA